MKIIRLFILACFAFTANVFADNSVMRVTIEEAVNIALQNNTSIVNAQKQIAIYENLIKEYKGSLYPEVNLSAGYTRHFDKATTVASGVKTNITKDNGYNAALNVRQLLWAGGKVKTGLNIAEILTQLQEQEFRRVQQEVSLNVRTVCYDAILSSATARIERENYEVNKKHLDYVKTRFSQGLSSDLEILRQEVKVANTMPAIITAENNHKLSLLNLNHLLGVDPENEIDLIENENLSLELDSSLDTLYQYALGHRPELKISQLAVEQAKENVRLYKSEYYPNLYLTAAEVYSADSNQFLAGSKENSWSTDVGVSISINLFQGGATAARVRQSDLELQQSRETLNETIRNVKIQVKRFWLDLAEAQERMRSQERAIDQAKEALRSVEVRFRNGLSDQLELNDATFDLNYTQVVYIRAMRDAYVALASIKWAIGN